MNDKCMPAGDQSAPSAQETDRRQNEPLTKVENSSGLSIGYDQPVPGTSAMQNRQGYCSCCQVLYTSLEQHILTTRHRDFVSNSRNNVAANSLMERFLQDVIQHHPYRYNDIRPTHADLPSLNLPLVPKEELTDVYCLPEDERETVGTREEMPSTDDESEPVILVKEVKSIMDNRQNERKALQTHKFNRSSFPGSTMPTKDLKRHRFSSVTMKSNSPTQGFLHRTSSNTDSSLYENPLPHNQPCSSQTAQNPSVSRRNAVVANCDLKADINTELLKHNNNSVSDTAFNILPAIKHMSAGPSFTGSTSSAFGIPKHHSEQSQGKFADSQSHLRNMTGACSSQGACAVGHPGTVMKIHSKEDHGYNRYKDQVLQAEDTVGEAIEEVIRKHCYSIPTQEKSFEDETTFHLLLGSLANPCNFSESGTSTEWDTPINRDPGPLKDLGCLKEAHIDLKDKKYESQLSSVLHLHPEAEKKENHKKEEEGNGDIKECKNDNGRLLPLPHIPQSFVGKTWSQVMNEDDLKIEALVREFRDGHFRCYFESESSASYGKKSKKQKQKVVAKTFTESNEISATKEAVPLFDHVNMYDGDDDDGDYNHSSLLIPVCKTPLEKKPEKRTWRLASRCQVVKVSHGTQTSMVNYPVVKRILRKYSDPTDAKQARYELDCEKTPDMKTRLCALKLPEAYSKIMSPLQPKSLVYVLSSPETTQCPLKPVCFRKTGRKRKSIESESTIRYTYKMTPLKFYDSLTNRILKTQPKGVACNPKTFTHVRQLFRSLSPDIKQMHDSENEDDLSSGLEADIPSEKDSSASCRKPGIGSCSRSTQSRNRIIQCPLNSSKPYTKGAMILSPLKNKTTEAFNVCKSRNSRRQALVKQDPKSEQGSSRNKLTGPNSQTKSVRTKVNLKRQRMENKGTKRPDFVSASRADNKKKIKFTKGLLSRGKPEKKLEASRKTGLRSSLEKENPNIKVSEKSAEVLMKRCKNPTEASRKQLENESSDNRRELRSSIGKSYSNKPLVKRNLRSSSKSI